MNNRIFLIFDEYEYEQAKDPLVWLQAQIEAFKARRAQQPEAFANTLIKAGNLATRLANMTTEGLLEFANDYASELTMEELVTEQVLSALIDRLEYGWTVRQCGITEDDKILPCPFCGDVNSVAGELEVTQMQGHYRVTCECGAKGRALRSPEAAIENWNRASNACYNII